MDTHNTPQVVESASASTAPQTNNSKTPYVIVVVVLGILLLLGFALGGAIASITYSALKYDTSITEDIIDDYTDDYDYYHDHHHDDTLDEYEYDYDDDYDEGELDFFKDPYMFDFEEDILIF